MARRNSSTSPANEAEVAPESTEEQNTETTEQAVEVPVQESVEEVAADADDRTDGESDDDKPADLTGFKEAVETAVGTADESDGSVAADNIKPVNEAYRSIDGVKGKNAARSWVEEQMKAALMGRNEFEPLGKIERMVKARAYVSVKEGLSAGGGSSAPKAPADPTTAFVQKVTSLRLALSLVESTVPDGVDASWGDKADDLLTEIAGQVEEYQAWTNSDDEDAEAPEVSPVVRAAFKLAAGRSTGGGGGVSTRVTGGPRRDIEKHLSQIFEDEPVGAFLTVNEIAKRASTEYGDDRPSAGAVSARLFPKPPRAPYSNNGIEATAKEGQPRGATKVA